MLSNVYKHNPFTKTFLIALEKWNLKEAWLWTTLTMFLTETILHN